MLPLDTTPGWTYVLAFAGVLLVAALGIVGLWLPLRHERTLANQEADLLAKLDPASQPAKDLKAIIEARIGRWHKQMFKKDQATGKEVTRRSLSTVLLTVAVILSLGSLVYTVWATLYGGP